MIQTKHFLVLFFKSTWLHSVL